MSEKDHESRGHILTEEGKVFEIPENCSTINSILEWVEKNFGEDVNVHISEMEVYFPEIDKTVKFIEKEDGFLISTKTLTEKELQKIVTAYPWLLDYLDR